jgi:integrase/recombinase XerD
MRKTATEKTAVKMSVEAATRAFLNHVKIERGLAENTIAAYTRDLRKFAAFAEQRGLELDAIARDHIVDFLSSLYRERLDSRSVSRHLVSVRNLFRFALTEELITGDPTLNLESPKIRK